MTRGAARGETLDRAVRRLDAWRRSPLAEPSASRCYKEWTHFCVRLPGDAEGHFIANLNVTERDLGTAVRTPRMVLLAHTGEVWRGSVEGFTDEKVSGAAGETGVQFGQNSIRWSDGAYHLVVGSEQCRADLRLVPLTLPTAPGTVFVSPTRALWWVAVPRLSASGWVELGNKRFWLEDALGYHDHNWGNFEWGADLAWDWGYVHPLDAACPWTVVFVRVSDPKAHRTLSQVVLLWHGSEHVRTFHNREIALELSGAHVGSRPFTLPGVMNLLVPGAASAVPARTMLRAEGPNDEIEVELTTSSTARIAVPHDREAFRTVVLNETVQAARVRGRTAAGETFDFTASAIVEFVRG